MGDVPRAKLTAPKAASWEIVRQDLIDAVLGSQKQLAYIHAGAGYGKTTLLSQISSARENTVWLFLDGESDLFTFLYTFSEAVLRSFPDYDFTVSEYLPFEDKDNFITIIANALICSIENLAKGFMIIIEDLHTVKAAQIRDLIVSFIKYKPENILLFLSSREAPWQELVPLRVRGNILELTQKELAFTREEATRILGFNDEHIYGITEGWPLALCSFKVLLENGVFLADVPVQGNQVLHTYLFYECTSRLSPEIVDFLKVTASLPELDAQMLDAILDKKNTRLILESLVSRNIFTIKTGNGQYRYHALFREYLLEEARDSDRLLLIEKAIHYYYKNTQYAKAAEYAILSKDQEMLQQIILVCYKSYIRDGNFSELHGWFHALGDSPGALSKELLVAKCVFLSSIGHFSEAKACLDMVIPQLSVNDQELYNEALLHKARVLRNFVSFEESNKLINDLLASSTITATEMYTIAIEKIYNFCWNSQIKEAYAAAYHLIETCAKNGDVKVKAWFERYLTAIHFFAGRMRDAVDSYEKSLELPENELQYLDLHSVGIYAAKAYQMMGDRLKAVSVISMELQKLRSTGRYEELWAGYLLAAEIHYQDIFIDRMNGGSQTYETAVKYFTLADEYAPLYRSNEFQIKWVKMQRLVCSLMFADGLKDDLIEEILSNLEEVGDYLKTLVLGRLFSYYLSVSDFPNAVKYASMSINVGERSGIMLVPITAYGILAKVAITMQDQAQAISLTKRFLQLCFQNGIYDYFRIRKTYDQILEFALDHGIEPDIARDFMEFTGSKAKKIYVRTLGGFSVFPYKNMKEPLKMRTKKERELLAYLLDAGHEGATKDQIYNAIWSESESEDVKKLIGVNLAHIKKDLANLGVESPVINQEKHYSICRDEILLDIDLFEKAAEEFKLKNSNEAAQRILSLYKGEYLSDFEAYWAISNRIRYNEVYQSALDFIGVK